MHPEKPMNSLSYLTFASSWCLATDLPGVKPVGQFPDAVPNSAKEMDWNETVIELAEDMVGVTYHFLP